MPNKKVFLSQTEITKIAELDILPFFADREDLPIMQHMSNGRVMWTVSDNMYQMYGELLFQNVDDDGNYSFVRNKKPMGLVHSNVIGSY